MSALRFSFQEMLNEVTSFAGLAEGFIASRSKAVLSRYSNELEGYRNSATRDAFDWEISEADPLTTIRSKSYEPGDGGQRFLIGEITAKWRIKKEPPTKKSRLASYFSLVGLASTRIRLRCVDAGNEAAEEIAMWRMEIADAKAPGCFFHTQILGQSEKFPFPSSLSIPRLPNILMSPTSVAEFAIAELFQDSWGPHTARQVPHLQRWAPIQKERFIRLLGWKLKQFEKTTGSPWSSLKAAKPGSDLFV
jgi:hypothetical protein